LKQELARLHKDYNYWKREDSWKVEEGPVGEMLVDKIKKVEAEIKNLKAEEEVSKALSSPIYPLDIRYIWLQHTDSNIATMAHFFGLSERARYPERIWGIGTGPSYYLGNREWTAEMREHILKRMDINLVHWKLNPNGGYYHILKDFWDWYNGRTVTLDWFNNQTMLLKVEPRNE
jgi:hypothetical protein